jgi:hypothetical protein
MLTNDELILPLLCKDDHLYDMKHKDVDQRPKWTLLLCGYIFYLDIPINYD